MTSFIMFFVFTHSDELIYDLQSVGNWERPCSASVSAFSGVPPILKMADFRSYRLPPAIMDSGQANNSNDIGMHKNNNILIFFIFFIWLFALSLNV